MKKNLIVVILLFGITICNGQVISKKDSLLVIRALDKVFKNFKNQTL
ncbi:hypothetical protein VB264_14630 [Arcicella aquatica]|uniref:Uncharacterized protein n=1 Tax=Arcicella aquatica TaxID=217141 RepID=A0ABU5QQL9_9BACT|nr:hypothetical protein [Arcicella aquatica]MEA5259029.1 hypothetical protein [Arcicella aquatica]